MVAGRRSHGSDFDLGCITKTLPQQAAEAPVIPELHPLVIPAQPGIHCAVPGSNRLPAKLMVNPADPTRRVTNRPPSKEDYRGLIALGQALIRVGLP